MSAIYCRCKTDYKAKEAVLAPDKTVCITNHEIHLHVSEYIYCILSVLKPMKYITRSWYCNGECISSSAIHDFMQKVPFSVGYHHQINAHWAALER